MFERIDDNALLDAEGSSPNACHERDASPDLRPISRDQVSKLHINNTISLAAVARTITQCIPPGIACHLPTAT